MPRLFFGLEIPPAIKTRLLAVQTPVEGARWQSAEQLHLTLLFLGAVDDERVPSLQASAGAVRQAPFELSVTGLRCFGQPARPRNLWAGVAPTQPVVDLHATLASHMCPEGGSSPSRTFCPHITLARFKRQTGSVQTLLAEYGDVGFGHFPVEAFCLFQSTRGEAGSVYTVFERFPLIAAD